METSCVSCKKYIAKENSSAKKRNKIDYCFSQIELFVAKKNELIEKIKNSTILIIFQMISLK